MRTVVAALLSLVPGSGVAQTWPCAPRPSGAPAHIWHINNAMGDNVAGNGSRANPWHDSSVIFAGGAWGGPKLTTVPYWHRGPTGAWIWTPNAQGPVSPGDEIDFAGTGTSYGVLAIEPRQPIVNYAWLTLTSEPGQTAHFDRIRAETVNKIAIDRIHVASMASRTEGYPLIMSGASDLLVTNSSFESAPDTVAASWTGAQWKTARKGVYLESRGRCQTIARSVSFRNVLSGGLIVSPWSTFSATIDGFGDDGLNWAGSHVSIIGARIVNSNLLGDGNHNDFIQGPFPGTPSDGSTVANNVLIRDAGRVYLPGSGIQGIDDFGYDRTATNLAVTGNVVITSGVCNGIAVAHVNGGIVANNLVRDDGGLANPGGCTVWLKLYPTLSNVTVTNNVATNFVMSSGMTNVTMTGNACLPLPGKICHQPQ
jgi:hypothetical protein